LAEHFGRHLEGDEAAQLTAVLERLVARRNADRD